MSLTALTPSKLSGEEGSPQLLRSLVDLASRNDRDRFDDLIDSQATGLARAITKDRLSEEEMIAMDRQGKDRLELTEREAARLAKLPDDQLRQDPFYLNVATNTYWLDFLESCLALEKRRNRRLNGETTDIPLAA